MIVIVTRYDVSKEADLEIFIKDGATVYLTGDGVYWLRHLSSSIYFKPEDAAQRGINPTSSSLPLEMNAFAELIHQHDKIHVI